MSTISGVFSLSLSLSFFPRRGYRSFFLKKEKCLESPEMSLALSIPLCCVSFRFLSINHYSDASKVVELTNIVQQKLQF